MQPDFSSLQGSFILKKDGFPGAKINSIAGRKIARLEALVKKLVEKKIK